MGGVERTASSPKGAHIAVRAFTALDPGGGPTKGGLGLDQFGFMVDNWPFTTGAKNQQPVLKEWRGC